MNKISKGHQRLAKADSERPVRFIGNIHRWQYKTALLLALGMTATAALPILITSSASAKQEPPIGQLLSQASQVIVPAGTNIPVRYDGADRIIVTPNETAPVTLTVAKNIRSASGKIQIPVDSQVKGELKPASGGSQFVAKQLILSTSGQSLSINAVSEIIAANQTVTEKTKPKTLQDAAIGAGAGAVLGAIFGGRVALGEVLGGAGVGALAGQLKGGGKKQVQVVEIDPDTDLHLFLRADLVRSQKQSADFTPLSQTQCEALRGAVAQRLGVGVTLTASPFQDYVNRKSGTGCLLTATGTGQEFSSPAEAIRKVGGVLTQLGWGKEPAYEAGSPTGMSAGYSRSNNFGLLRAEWEPAPGVNCPSDQPIAACVIAPRQKLYIITLNLAQMSSVPR